MIEPGIYFGLGEDDYHADDSFSSSGIKNLLVSPLTYWVNSPMNPDYEEATSDPMRTGKAFHKRIVEGAEAFDECYVQELDPADYPEVLVTADDLKARLSELGLKKSGAKIDLIKRLQEAEPDTQIWDLLLEQHEGAHEGKILIKPDLYESVQRAAAIVDRQVGKAFTGGYPEVSLFWIDELGVRMKCRVDYLKTQAQVELKSFNNPFKRPLDKAIATAMANEGYMVQGVVYLHSVQQVKEMLRAGKGVVSGDVDPAWLEAFKNHPDHAFIFVFVEQGKVPNVRVREFTRGAHGGDLNLYFMTPWQRYREAMETYARYREHYGEKPWIENDPMRPFEDRDFPLWAFD